MPVAPNSGHFAPPPHMAQLQAPAQPPPAFDAPLTGVSRRRPRWVIPAIAAAVALFFILAGAAAIAVRSENGASTTNTSPSPSGQQPTTAAQPSPTPSATAANTATATASPATSPTRAATATVAAAAPTVTPGGPPTVRQRYTVVAGDSCDGIRSKFNFPFESYPEFFTALWRLSGKTAATQCTFSPGDIVCIPALSDLANAAVLTTDTACLTQGRT